MQLITVALLTLSVASTWAADTCKSEQYGKFLTCLNTAINSDWTKIKADPSKFLDSQEALYQQCFKTSSCSVKLDFKDFTEGLGDLKSLADSIRQLWDGAPRGFQNCILTDARNKFFTMLQECVKEKIPTFELPADLPDVPLPPNDMYTNTDMRKNLIKYVNDKLVAVIGTRQCQNNNKDIIDCIKADLKAQTSTCITNNLCGPACKSSYKSTCEVVAKCIPEILEGKRGDITSLLDKSRNTATKFLNTCEKEAQKEDPKYRYSRKLILKTFEDIQPILEDTTKAGKFTNLFKDTVEAYFDTNALCSGGCQ